MTTPAAIRRLRVSSLANNLGGRLWNPRIRWTEKHAVFIELEAADGLVGLGECWCFDASPKALIAFAETEVCPQLPGKTPEEIRAVLEELTERATLTARHGILASVISGLDLALWDLAAQRAGQPLWQLFDATGPGTCQVYASGGLYAEDKGPTELAEELSGYARQGFRAVKMKVGSLSLEADAARVAAARAALGPDCGLIVDGVSSFDRDQALRFFDLVRDSNPLAFQAPVPPSDLAGMRRLHDAGVPVMAGEAEYRAELFDALIDEGAVSLLQVAPIACGGPSRVLALAERCRKAGIGLSLETCSTAVATLAALHLGAACAETAHVEIHQVHRVLFEEAAIPPPNADAGSLAPPAAPGLGFALPPGGGVPAFDLTEAVPQDAPQEPPSVALPLHI